MERQIKFISVDQLMFDAKNPRVPKKLFGISDEEKIIEYMVKFGNIIELMSSIAENGYFTAEPLLVVGQQNGLYKVVEGNRRLAALKILNNPSITSLRTKAIREIVDEVGATVPKEVPCIVYGNESEIIDYLGFRHITGVKDWGALEKARYLDTLYKQHVDDYGSTEIYSKLAKMIGSRADYVRKLHAALKLYEKANDAAYYGLEIKDSDIEFSWITTAIGFNAINDYLGLKGKDYSIENVNDENFANLFMWMFDPEKSVVRESRQISQLAEVLGAKQAKEKLESGAQLTEAILFTSHPNVYFTDLLKRAKDNMLQAKQAIEQLGSEPKEAEELLSDIMKLRKTISGALNAMFHDEEDDD